MTQVDAFLRRWKVFALVRWHADWLLHCMLPTAAECFHVRPLKFCVFLWPCIFSVSLWSIRPANTWAVNSTVILANQADQRVRWRATNCWFVKEVHSLTTCSLGLSQKWAHFSLVNVDRAKSRPSSSSRLSWNKTVFFIGQMSQMTTFQQKCTYFYVNCWNHNVITLAAISDSE